MDAAVETNRVEREIIIDARPEIVWGLLVDSREITRWMGVVASLDARHGGRYRIEVIPGHVASGQFVEVEAPRRLVYTWGWEGSQSVPPGSTTVVFELEPRGNGTLLRLEHRNLPDAKASASHEKGWGHYMERLAAVASSGNAGADPWVKDCPPM